MTEYANGGQPAINDKIRWEVTEGQGKTGVPLGDYRGVVEEIASNIGKNAQTLIVATVSDGEKARITPITAPGSVQRLNV